jgi:hypothetical protein
VVQVLPLPVSCTHLLAKQLSNVAALLSSQSPGPLQQPSLGVVVQRKLLPQAGSPQTSLLWQSSALAQQPSPPPLYV